MMPEDSELEGFYRLLRNEKVTAKALLQPHVDATVKRCTAAKTVLVSHDTTVFNYGGENTRADLAPTTYGGKGHGFFFHASLAIAADGTKEPLGVLNDHCWSRTEKKYERGRWWDAIKDTEALKPAGVEFIHVADREAEDYEILCKLTAAKVRFVFRLKYNRKVVLPEGLGANYVKNLLEGKAGKCARAVNLSRRGKKGPSLQTKYHPPRQERSAELHFSATQAKLKRPLDSDKELPEALDINIVRVWEPDPPAGEEPVEWMLLTQEPIARDDDMVLVVDHYRTRWVIEEFFQGLKTGCGMETRQLESYTTITKALAIAVPMAWALLRLRTAAIQCVGLPAESVLTPLQLKVLYKAAIKPLPDNLTADQAYLAIAKLGGHITNNGFPGWRILARGYRKLLDLTTGHSLSQV